MTQMLRRPEDDAARPAPPTASVHEALREHHPELPVQRLRRSTLVALSWALEDEFCTRASAPVLVGVFGATPGADEPGFAQSRERWERLADTASATFVLAELDDQRLDADEGPARLVHLERDHPMREEWAIVCDDADMPVVLSASEVPEQPAGPDRLHDVVWSIDPHAVRTAARAAVRAAAEQGSPDAAPVLYRLADEPRPTVADPVATSHLVARLVAYVDQFGSG